MRLPAVTRDRLPHVAGGRHKRQAATCGYRPSQETGCHMRLAAVIRDRRPHAAAGRHKRQAARCGCRPSQETGCHMRLPAIHWLPQTKHGHDQRSHRYFSHAYRLEMYRVFASASPDNPHCFNIRIHIRIRGCG